MSDDLIARVADDLASGRPIDWPAVIAAAATPSQRGQLESLRFVHQMERGASRGGSGVSVTETTADVPAGGSVATSPQALWGRHLLVHRAGSGSFGTVYRAIDPDLQLDVAIKVLHRHVDNELLREQLLDEGRKLARIRHQNVVRVFGTEVHGTQVGLCTEFIHGETLEAEVSEHGTFSQAQAIDVGEAVCQALSAVHRAGFIHRDVKARNVMRERDTGRIVLMDFGTGRELDQEIASPSIGLVGTAIYMAPELFENHGASRASDVYSVGVLLYYVLTGAYPVEGASIQELKVAHRKGLRTALGDRRPDLSPAFLRVVEKALGPKGSRYGTPAALCADLEAVRVERSPWTQRLKVASVAAATVIGALIVLGFINTYYFNHALGRAAFVDDGVLEWMKWGAKGIVSPIVIAAFLVVAVTLILEILQLLTTVSATARRAERSLAELVHRWSLDDVKTRSSISFLASAMVLFAGWWYCTPMLATLTSIVPDISTVRFDQILWLSPIYGEDHFLYRKVFLGTTIACVMFWYPTVRLAMRTRQPIPRRAVIGGSTVLAFSLILLDFPYRLLTHDIDFDEVTWERRACHVLAARNDERLIFCPSLPAPRNRVVKADAVTPLHSPEIEWGVDGPVEFKSKKSIFKFLLNPPATARDGQIP